MKELARSKGGECLSDVYVNTNTKLKWRCEEGHEWKAVPSSIKTGTWCPYCAGVAKSTIEEMRQIASDRGGECLSEEYVGSHSKLEWKCTNNHTWEATPTDIKSDKWCPYCSSGISERVCRKTFENIFQKDFPKTKPQWLINSRGNRMELDGYCDSLNIAFEYQGIQHFRRKDIFHINDGEFNQRRRDDELKRQLCRNKEVTLIEVPYYVKYKDMFNYIIGELQKNGIELPNIPIDAYDYQTYEGVYDPKNLLEFQEIAKSRGGECLSESYMGIDEKMRWRCDKGHVWEATPYHIKHRNQWCPECAGIVKLNIEEMRHIAKKRGGKCLSEEYINLLTKLKWQCKERHEWEATPGNIKSGKWCPYCLGLYKTIEDMRKIAKERGGKCLSEKYINSQTKLKWRCDKGHIWMAVPSSIINAGAWCPDCAGNVQLTIEEMKQIAKSRDGECLSDVYVNADTKLKWRCKKGHEWEANPRNIKHGKQWCPNCGGTVKLTIEEMRQIAKSRDGECLSEKYVNNRTKLKWRCKKGHEWKAVPGSIKNGKKWCPECAGIVKLTIEEMRQIAQDRGGECLSEEYINLSTKLKWRCKEGHEWEATPRSIKHGKQWCRICSKKEMKN
jgi:hypothetical protein